MSYYQEKCHDELLNSVDKYSFTHGINFTHDINFTVDITKYPLDKILSLSYQEPYGRNCMYAILSNSIADNLKIK